MNTFKSVFAIVTALGFALAGFAAAIWLVLTQVQIVMKYGYDPLITRAIMLYLFVAIVAGLFKRVSRNS